MTRSRGPRAASSNEVSVSGTNLRIPPVVVGDSGIAQAFDERSGDARAHRCHEVEPVRRQAWAQNRHLDDHPALPTDVGNALDYS